jgi:hypothetical protein
MSKLGCLGIQEHMTLPAEGETGRRGTINIALLALAEGEPGRRGSINMALLTEGAVEL